MIKNVIFDYGQVLVHVDSEYMTAQYIENKEDTELVSKVIFDRLYWDKLDAGTISDDEVVRLCRERLPEKYYDAVPEIYYDWIYNLPPVEGMEEILIRLKNKGVRLFLLSNISFYFSDHAHEFPVLSHFEKCFFSAECGFTKPSKEIFNHVFKVGNIAPSETLFVDDSEKNINGAKNCGILTYLFDGDVKKLEKHLEDCGII